MREVPLTKGYVALVDDEDYERVMQFKWHAIGGQGSKRVYGVRTTNKHTAIPLSHEIMPPPPGMVINHIDNNGLNYCRNNLRICSVGNIRTAQGLLTRNTSGYKGVSFVKKSKRWVARIARNGKSTHIGLFDDIEAAANAYDDATRTFHGEFGYYNFPLPGEKSARVAP